MAISKPMQLDKIRNKKCENLRRFLNAKSLAFIGGKSLAGSMRYCRELGFRGPVWSVHPKYKHIGGFSCVPTISDLPNAPDAAFVAVPSRECVDVVKHLSDFGTLGTVCYSGGFSEIGETDLERELLKAASEMAMIGPNCYGFVNFLDGVAAIYDGHGTERRERGVACISQSGTIATNMILSDRSVPFSHLINVGNQTVTDMADVIDAIADDPRVDGILLYVESIRDSTTFSAAVTKALNIGKPVVCLKGATTKSGQNFSKSHTGKIAGNIEMYDAYLSELGVISVRTLSEILEMGKLIAWNGMPTGNRVAVETCSGSDVIQCADLAARHNITFPLPDGSTQAEIKQLIPNIAVPSNPLDVTMAIWGNQEVQAMALKLLSKQPVDALAVIINIPSTLEDPSYLPTVMAVIDAKKNSQLPTYAISNLPEGLPLSIRKLLRDGGVIPMQGLEDAFTCIGLAVKFVERKRQMPKWANVAPLPVGVGARSSRATLSDLESRLELQRYGMPVVVPHVCTDAITAIEKATRIGYPVVIKGVGRGMIHKSDVGAVAIDICDADAVYQAWETVSALPNVEDLTIEAFVDDAIAEVLIGVKHDPVLGFAIVLGAGGIYTEIFQDIVTLMVPVSPEQVKSALCQLKCFAILIGHRSQLSGDLEALVDLVVSISTYAEKNAKTLVELEINPALVRPAGRGVVVVDSIIIHQQEGY